MSSSEGKFFSKVKNAFKSDKKDSSTPESPTSPKKSTKSGDVSTTKDHENIANQAYDEGRKFFHRKHKSGASASSDSKSKSTAVGTTGATAGAGAGAGTTTTTATTAAGKDNHKDLLKEAYEEGHKFFHFHHKFGNSSHTPKSQHDEQFTTGVGAAAVGAGVGTAVATSTADAAAHSTTSSGDREILAESSVGRVVTSPPKRSREPLDHTITGDFANSKKPTDPTVIASGKVDDSHQPGVDDDGEQNYTEGAKIIEGKGEFFDPSDTQGGVLAAAVGAGVGAATGEAVAQREYNERTKAEYQDLSNLKTKPSAYQDNSKDTGISLEDDFDFQAVKDEAYQEGNKQGRKDFQSSANKENTSRDNEAGSGTAIVGGSSKVDPSKQKEIHEQNKSAYNPDGVTGILEQNHNKGASSHSRKPPPTTSAGDGASSSSSSSNQYQSTDLDQKRTKDLSSTGFNPKSNDDSNVAAGANTTTATGAATIAGTSALAAGIVAAGGLGSGSGSGSDVNKPSNEGSYAVQSGDRQRNLEDDRRISDLDRQLKQTEDKIDQYKQEPSNASNYAVHDEPIQTPRLKSIGDDDDTVSGGLGSSSKNTTEVSSDAASTGAAAGATVGAAGALGAAAAYLGLKKKQTSSTTEKEPVATYNDSKPVTDAAYIAGQVKSSQDASFVQGQVAGINDEAYKAGYQQGKDLYEGIDKNSTQHRDALFGANEEGSKTLDPNAGGSAAQTGGLFQSTKEAAIGATAAVTGALGLGAAALTSSSSDTNKDTLDDAYDTGKSRGNTELKTTGEYTNTGDDISKEAYQAGKDKASYEHNSSYGATGTGTGSGSGSESSNTGYLAAAGAAVGGAVGAVGAALTGKSNKEQAVEDSLIADAEKDYPSIAKLPAHKVKKDQLKKEETPAQDATIDEKELVNANNRDIWERETESYNKQHGFSNPKESLLQEAEDVDPAIVKFPAHSIDRNELKRETTLGEDADLTDKDLVYNNQEKLLERETGEYNKAHGFSDPKESLLQQAEDVDPNIKKLPAHKTNKKELKKEEKPAFDVNDYERELASKDAFRELERETEDYNKQHGFSNPKESLLQEAEDSDPSIEKLPAHKVNTGALEKEETLGKTVTEAEEDYVYTNQEREWERKTDAYNKSHGFSNPMESLLQEAEDADPAIDKLPAHKRNKKELNKEKSLSKNATLGEREVVESNQLDEWERDAEDYNVKHGFVNPKESLLQEAEDADLKVNKSSAYGKTGEVPAVSKDLSKPYGSTTAPSGHDSTVRDTTSSATGAATDSLTSSSSKGYLAAAGAALGGAVGYAFGGKSSKEHDVHDSLVQDAEKDDPNIAALPAHKVNENELKRETTLGPGATIEDKELVNANNRKLWEKEADEYNKAHGFSDPKESLLQEAEDHDAKISKFPAHSGSEKLPASSRDVSSGVEKDSPSSKGYLDAAGAALGGAAGYAFGGKSKNQDADDTFEEKEDVNAGNSKLLEKETDEYNKKHAITKPTESLIQEAEDADPNINKLPAYNADKKELKREKTLGADATEDEKEIISSNNRKLWEQETEEYNKKHGFTGQTGSLLAVAEDADPSIAKLPSYNGEVHDSSAPGTKGAQGDSNVQKLPDNYRTARPDEIKKSLADPNALGAANTTTEATTGAVTGLSGAGLTKTELHDEGYQRGKSDESSTYYSEANLPTHQRTVSGASYNATRPIGDSEILEPDLDSTDTSNHKCESKSLPAATAAAAIGAGAGIAAAESKNKNKTKGLTGSKDTVSGLDPNLKQQLYQEGYTKGNGIASGTGSSSSGNAVGADSDIGVYAAAVGAGAGLAAAEVKSSTKKGLTGSKDVNSTLDPTLKQKFYDEGYSQGQSPFLEKQHGSNLKQTSYDAGYSQGTRGVGNAGVVEPTTTTSTLDSKVKQDLYEQGYAKGSTEAKQERDARRSGPGAYGSSFGTNHREAAVIGSVAGAAAGVGAAVAAASAHGGRESRKKSDPSQEEFVDVGNNTKGIGKSADDDTLVVEVIGIEDKDEALRTAKRASKKLDDKGVDLSGGKLVINANTKEIYKDNTVGSSATSGSSDLSQKSKDISSSPTVGRHDAHVGNNNHLGSSGVSDDSGKLDSYQQTEAAKKRLAEAARKNVSSTQKHPQGTSSGLSPVEISALCAGAGAGAGLAAAEHESGTKRRDIDASQDTSDVALSQKHKYPDASDYSGQPPIKKQDTNDAPEVKSPPTTATDEDEIFVNVKGIKDNNLATKIARTAVARLQKTHASVVANVKELQVDASSGIVRDENGIEIAQYPDLSIDRINSGKRVSSHESKSPVQGSRSPTTSHHNHHGHHGHHQGQVSPSSTRSSKKEVIPSGSSGLGGGALAGAASGALATAAAAAAVRKSNDSDRPVITADAPPHPSQQSTGVNSTKHGSDKSTKGLTNKSLVDPSSLHNNSSGNTGKVPSATGGISDATATKSSGHSTIPGFNFAGIPGFNGPTDTSSGGQSKDSNSSTGYSDPATSSHAGVLGSSSGTKSSGSNGYDELSKAPKYPTEEPNSPSLNIGSHQQPNVPGIGSHLDSTNADVGNYSLGSTSRTKNRIPSSTNTGIESSGGSNSGVKAAEIPKSFARPEASTIKSDPTPTTRTDITEQEQEQDSSFLSAADADTSAYSMPGSWTS